MNQDPDPDSTRRITPADARAGEVLKRQRAGRAGRRLHICPQCQSRLVQPMEWREAQLELWMLTLSCPNCNWITEGVFSQRQVDAFEEQLEEGLGEILDDLTQLAQANMVEEVERFAAALYSELITPEDF
jgi:hypothetical protein